MIIDYSTQTPNQIYNLMASSIIPRPIAWISTLNNDGTINLAPFSYFTPLSSNPATVIVSIGHKENGEVKDTLKNIQQNKKCTICIASPEFMEDLHQSSATLEYGESECKKLGIEMKTIDVSYPPIVKGVPIGLLCDFHSIVELDGKTIPTILEIKQHYIDDENIEINNERYKIDFEPLMRIAREYGTLGKRIKHHL